MSAYIPNLFAIILAGGSGMRFWPLSRELNPKQLLSVFGTESLLMQAMHRILPLIDPQRGSVRIVTNERLLGALQEHLTCFENTSRKVHYLVEPVGRNTAPAIALAAAELVAEDDDAVMIVLPSDHVLDNGVVWTDTITAAACLAADGYLVNIGVQPTHPETGYGYIEAGDPLPQYNFGVAAPRKANQFVEKPSYPRAKAFVESGTHYWNAGICIARAAQVLAELGERSEAGRQIVDTCRWIATIPRAEWTSDEVRQRFAALTSVSIDNALFELSPNVVMIPTELGWRDVGSLRALELLAEPDAHGNTRLGRGVDIDSHDNLVYSSDRLVALLGVQEMVVVDTPDATLVCPKDRCQDVRLVVDALKTIGAEEILEPRASLRPWGSWMTLLKGAGFQIKLLELKPGAYSGVHRHLHHTEHWVVLEGTARVMRDYNLTDIGVTESIVIPPGTVHRLENCTHEPLRIIEIQQGDMLGEEDIIRLTADMEEHQ